MLLFGRTTFALILIAAQALSWKALAHYPDHSRLIWPDDRVGMEYLQNGPKRDLRHDPIVMAYLEQHPVYVSLTTSPKRISRIKHVFETLDLTHVREILLVLPQRFGRNGQAYDIPEELSGDPRVRVLRIDKDLGPISKMLPAIEYASSMDPNALVISVDDDIAYSAGMVNEIIFHLARSRRQVFGGSVPNIAEWGIDAGLWPFQKDRGDIVEGWAGIGYRAGEIPVDRMRELSQLSKSTYASDDVVISYALAEAGILKSRVRSPYYDCEKNRFFAYGMEEDALHRGAGLENKPADLGDYNPLKYRQSMIDMNRWPAGACEMQPAL